MEEMKFRFTVQPYQTDAVNRVADVFAGQPFSDLFAYRRDAKIERRLENLYQSEEELLTGYANPVLKLSSKQILRNIQDVQRKQNLHLSDKLTKGPGLCSLDVEMETGTGKTYVYIKTMFELNQRYGWNKFIVVVPSIAIREGVKKSFEITQDHFMELYGKKIRFFVYDSGNLTDIDNYSQNSGISAMIINMQAFNVGKKGTKASRRILEELDDFGSRRPIDVIAANRPILILDEPQKMGGQATQKNLQQFNPLFSLNYSATHKDHHDLVYVLDAVDAYNEKLVKRIEVKGFDLCSLPGTDRYLYFEGIDLSPKRGPRARLEFEVRHKSGIRREMRAVTCGDDLYALSNELEEYRGLCVADIDPLKNSISFTDGRTLSAGEIVANNSDKNLRRIQIRETIQSHFEKEQSLFERGIKTLSLFFIDEVAKYRCYDENGDECPSEYSVIFEEEYRNILNTVLTEWGISEKYRKYLESIDATETHTGYFSVDKKGRKIDSKLKRGTDKSDDVCAYDLILKDKERLLSFATPERFIFSHSALREGWDNPNVFQICTLKHDSGSPTQKRQEVGRGLRLCVNQDGDRMDAKRLHSQVHEINTLTVIASDGYREFVADLQTGIRDDLYQRPSIVSEEYFSGKSLWIDGNQISISEKQATRIYNYLVKNDYVDDEKHLTEKYHNARENKTLAPMPEELNAVAEAAFKLIDSIFDPHALDGMISNGRNSKVMNNPLNSNFHKKEFQKLWESINHKCAYLVDFDSDELIRKAVASIDEKLLVAPLQYVVTSGAQGKNWSFDAVNEQRGFNNTRRKTVELAVSESSSVKYDLIGEIAKRITLTRKTTAAILTRIKPEKFDMFRTNPEEFIARVSDLIQEQKATMVVEHIGYSLLDETYSSDIFTQDKNILAERARPAKRNVQDYVVVDSDVERKFAAEMDIADEVEVYAKLPKGFAIPTPVGSYSPDWAIVLRREDVKHIFFVAETKGTMSSMSLKPVESAKISCARKLFEELSSKANQKINYHEVDTFENLLNLLSAE